MEYYDFYLVRKQDDGKYHLAGPFILEDGKYKPMSIINRSRSYINDDILYEFNELPVDKMSEEIVEMATSESFDGSSRHSIASIVPLRIVIIQHDPKPIQGYMLIEDYEEFDYEEPWLYTDLLRSYEWYAGLSETEKQKYAYISTVDITSKKYIFNVIVEMVYELVLDDDYDNYHVMVVKT